MDVHDISRYREAKLLLPHLKDLLQKLAEMESALFMYSGFMPVAKILATIKIQKSYIVDCYETYKRIENNKGKL